MTFNFVASLLCPSHTPINGLVMNPKKEPTSGFSSTCCTGGCGWLRRSPEVAVGNPVTKRLIQIRLEIKSTKPEVTTTCHLRIVVAHLGLLCLLRDYEELLRLSLSVPHCPCVEGLHLWLHLMHLLLGLHLLRSESKLLLLLLLVEGGCGSQLRLVLELRLCLTISSIAVSMSITLLVAVRWPSVDVNNNFLRLFILTKIILRIPVRLIAASLSFALVVALVVALALEDHG